MKGFDATLYGVLVYALRRTRGMRKASDLAEAMTRLGVKTSERSMWAIERGDQIAGVDRHLAICHLLEPKPGYFTPAFVVEETDGQTETGRQ